MGILNKLKQIFTADPASSFPPASQRDASEAVASYQRMVKEIDSVVAERAEDELHNRFEDEMWEEGERRFRDDPNFREAYIREALANARAGAGPDYWSDSYDEFEAEFEAELRSPAFAPKDSTVLYAVVQEFRNAEGKKAELSSHEQEKQKIISEIKAANSAMPQQDDRNKQSIAGPKFR